MKSYLTKANSGKPRFLEMCVKVEVHISFDCKGFLSKVFTYFEIGSV